MRCHAYSREQVTDLESKKQSLYMHWHVSTVSQIMYYHLYFFIVLKQPSTDVVHSSQGGGYKIDGEDS